MTETILLFDVDGTLTEPRKVITERMVEELLLVKQKYILAFVTGSDRDKIVEQLGEKVISLFEYQFCNQLDKSQTLAMMPQTANIVFFGDEICPVGDDLTLAQAVIDRNGEAYAVDNYFDVIKVLEKV